MDMILSIILIFAHDAEFKMELSGAFKHTVTTYQGAVIETTAHEHCRDYATKVKDAYLSLPAPPAGKIIGYEFKCGDSPVYLLLPPTE